MDVLAGLMCFQTPRAPSVRGFFALASRVPSYATPITSPSISCFCVTGIS